jgi:hypothetical protein
VFELFRDGGNLCTHLRANVSLDEVVDLIEPDDGTQGEIREIDGGIDEA